VLDVGLLPAADAGQLQVRAAQLSPALAAVAGDAGVRVSFGTPGNAGVVALLSREGDIEPPAPRLVQVGNDLAAFGQLGFRVDLANGGRTVDGGVDAGIEAGADAATDAGHDPVAQELLWMTLAQAQSLVDPSTDPRTYFGQSTPYVVAVLGDPAAGSPFSDASYDGYGLHILVLPSRPKGAGL